MKGYFQVKQIKKQKPNKINNDKPTRAKMAIFRVQVLVILYSVLRRYYYYYC